MNLFVVGLSHKTAPVEVREKLALSGPELEQVCRQVAETPQVDEALVLSTCNRVEVYGVAESVEDGFAAVSTLLAGRAGGMKPEELIPHLYHYPGNGAISHMFRVAASLDSMVLGEPQILGQFKDAFEAALAAGSTGMILNKMAKKAISVGKRARTETGIAENAVSVSYAAVELAKKMFSNLSKQRVLLLGAGEMAELAIRHLMAGGVTGVTIATRTTENARKLADHFGAEGSSARALPFADYPDHLAEVDIVLCSTGAPDYVIGPAAVNAAIRTRGHRPMLLIDISVPRNIDPAVGKLGDAYLYDIDDLQSVVDANLKERRAEAAKAMRIVEEEVDTAARWVRSLDVVPTIMALRGHAEEIAQGEVDRVLARLSHLPDKERELIAGLGNAIVAKLLHRPMSSLRQDAQENNGSGMVETTRRLFALPDEPTSRPEGESAEKSKDDAAPTRQRRRNTG